MQVILEQLLVYLIFFGIPAGILIWFIVSLVMFLRTPKEDTEKRKTRKVLTIVSGAIAGVMALSIIGIVVMFALAITHM